MATPSGTRSLGARLEPLQARALEQLNKTTELTPPQLRSLTERMKVTRFAKGQTIYDGHHLEGSVYFISSGIAKLTCLNRDNDRLLLEVLAPGDVLSIPSLLPDVRHTLQCEAFTECRVGIIAPEELVESIMKLRLPAFRAALGLTMGRWWQLLLRHFPFSGPEP
jgi:CRP-like cAMP-binding protein